MLHQIGSCVTEPAAGGRIRCRSYASFLALDPAGSPVLKGYGTYDDLWVLDDGEWRLALLCSNAGIVSFGRAWEVPASD